MQLAFIQTLCHCSCSTFTPNSRGPSTIKSRPLSEFLGLGSCQSSLTYLFPNLQTLVVLGPSTHTPSLGPMRVPGILCTFYLPRRTL